MVPQRSQDIRFAFEELVGLPIRRTLQIQKLERHRTIPCRVMRKVCVPERTTSQRPGDHKAIAERCAFSECVRVTMQWLFENE